MMSDNPGASSFLREQLTPVKPPENGRVAKLIADLGSDRFSVREGATQALAELGASPRG